MHPGFDPKQVPIVRHDGHLPAIAPPLLTPDRLRDAFATTLPNSIAPNAQPWQPVLSGEPPYPFAASSPASTASPNSSPHPAAVLVALVPHPAGLQVLLTQRSAGLSKHPGQVAFAGGRVDASDGSPRAAALREAKEEIGLDSTWVDCIGHLPNYISGSGFAITPVIALLNPGFTLDLNPAEVSRVYEVPLDYLMHPANHRLHRFDWTDADGQMQQRQWLSMPYALGMAHECYIWGVSAAILRNLYHYVYNAFYPTLE